MPIAWVPPEILLEYRGYTISYLYEGDMLDGRKLTDRFTLSQSDDMGAFDLRQLPVISGGECFREDGNFSLIRLLKQTIDSGFFDDWEDDTGRSYRALLTQEERLDAEIRAKSSGVIVVGWFTLPVDPGDG